MNGRIKSFEERIAEAQTALKELYWLLEGLKKELQNK